MSASIRLTKRNYNRPSLLQQIGGKRNSSESSPRMAAIAQRQAVIDLSTPKKDVTRPPQDSDAESSPLAPRGDIKPSKFGKRDEQLKNGEEAKQPSRVSERPKRDVKVDVSVPSSQSTSGSSSNGKRAREEEEEDSSSACLSRPSSQPLGFQHGVFSQSSQSKRNQRGYGSKSKRGPGSSQTKVNPSPEKMESKKLMTYSVTSTPESTPQKKPTLIKYDIVTSPEAPGHGKTEIATFKAPQVVSSPSPKRERTLEMQPTYVDFSDDDVELPPLSESIESRNIERLLKQKQGEDSRKPVPQFKVHDIPELTGGRTLKDLGLTQIDLDMADQDTAPELPDHLIECPMCREPVEKTFLQEFSQEYSGGERLTVASQTRFCHSHKKRSARKDWTSRGYPTINWDALNSRINEHHKYLRSLLKPNTSSYYHDQMTEALRSSSKNKTTLKSRILNGGSITPGYYGTRGLRIMSENIMDKFTPQLRSLAKTDDLIFAQGVSPFVQTVLVPELAVRLIKEDMQVTTAEARDILKESATVGDLLQEEQDEVVTKDEEDSLVC